MQIICTLLQTDNHTSTPPHRFLEAGCPSCHPTNNVKALKALSANSSVSINETKLKKEKSDGEIPGQV